MKVIITEAAWKRLDNEETVRWLWRRGVQCRRALRDGVDVIELDAVTQPRDYVEDEG